MIKTYILGKRSFLSKKLYEKIDGSKLYTVNELIKKFNSTNHLKKKINVIYNHSFPLSKLSSTENLDQLINLNVNKLRKFLSQVNKNKIKIDKFIFSSSSSVYGIKTENIDLIRANQNKKIYALTKLFSETLINSYNKKIAKNIFIGRIFNIYGNGESNSLISKIIKHKKNKEKIILYNRNKSSRDFIHIDDIVSIYIKVLKNKDISGTYDIGTGKSYNIKNLINRYFDKKMQLNMSSIKNHEIEFSKANNKRLLSKIGKLKFVDLYKFLDNQLHNIKKY